MAMLLAHRCELLLQTQNKRRKLQFESVREHVVEAHLGLEVQCPTFLTLALDVGGRLYASAVLPLDLMMGSRVGPKTGLDASQNGNMSSNCRKSRARNGEIIVQAAEMKLYFRRSRMCTDGA
jgi:hypothetical protein